MTVTALALIPGATLGTSSANLYASPTGTTSVVKRAVFTNTSGSAVTVSVNIVRSGGSSGTANQLIDAQPIAPGGTYVSPELANMTLGPGDAIFANANAASAVNLMVSGIQIV